MANFFSWMVDNWQNLVGAIVALLSGVIAIAMLIPGDSPEKQLQKVVDFIKKFSAKPPVKE